MTTGQTAGFAPAQPLRPTPSPCRWRRWAYRTWPASRRQQRRNAPRSGRGAVLFPQAHTGVLSPGLLKLVELIERHRVDGGQSLRVGHFLQNGKSGVHIGQLADAPHEAGAPTAELRQRVRPAVMLESKHILSGQLLAVLRLLGSHQRLLAR